MVILRLQAHLGEEMLKQITASDNAVEGAVASRCREFEDVMSTLMQNPCSEEDLAYEQAKKEAIKNTLVALGCTPCDRCNSNGFGCTEEEAKRMRQIQVSGRAHGWGAVLGVTV